MKKYAIIVIITILALALILLISPTLTGRIIQEDKYLYTKAICDENNYCEDYVVECDGNNLINFRATGLSIQQDSDWVDTREEKELC